MVIGKCIVESRYILGSRVPWTFSRQDQDYQRFATKHKSRQRRRNGMRAEVNCFLAVNGGDGDVDTLWTPVYTLRPGASTMATVT